MSRLAVKNTWRSNTEYSARIPQMTKPSKNHTKWCVSWTCKKILLSIYCNMGSVQRIPKCKNHWFVKNTKITLNFSVLSLCEYFKNKNQRSTYGLCICTIKFGLGLKMVSLEYLYQSLPEFGFEATLRLHGGRGRVSC